MATQLTVVSSIQINRTHLVRNLDNGEKSFTTAGDGGPTPGWLAIPSATETHVELELTSAGWLRMVNIGEHPVTWGFATAALKGRMSPGAPAQFQLAPTTLDLYFQASGGDSEIVLEVLEA